LTLNIDYFIISFILIVITVKRNSNLAFTLLREPPVGARRWGSEMKLALELPGGNK